VGEDFDEQLMATLADAGTGNYYYIRSGDDLARIFSDEFETARESVARGLAVSILPAAGVEVVDAAGYPLERGAEGETVFRPGRLRGRPAICFAASAALEGTLSSAASLPSTPRAASGSRRVRGAAHRRGRRSDDFYASVDPESWSRSVTVDQYNDLRRKVAAELKAGEAQAAKMRIEAFRDKTEQMNARIQSPGVAAQLEALRSLGDEVDEHASGRRTMSPAEIKQLQSLGYSEGRAGDRK
jgi:Ca-activated chloride channel family protein